MVKVRFANESSAVEAGEFNFDDFKFSSIFDTEVFGWWKETFVSISRKDWDERPISKKKIDHDLSPVLKSIPLSKFQEVRYDGS